MESGEREPETEAEKEEQEERDRRDDEDDEEERLHREEREEDEEDDSPYSDDMTGPSQVARGVPSRELRGNSK